MWDRIVDRTPPGREIDVIPGKNLAAEMPYKSFVTRRDQDEAATTYLQRQMQLIMDNTREPFMMVNRELKIVALNKAMSKGVQSFLGLTVEKDQAFSDLAQWDQYGMIKQTFQEVLNGKELDIEIPFKTLDGRSYIYLNHFSPAYNERNEIVAAIVSSQDITKKRRAEEALKHSEELWKFALENGYQGVWDWNIQTNEVFYSKRWKELLGYREDENAKSLEDWEKRIHPGDKDKVFSDIDKHLHAEDPSYENIYRLRCKDDSYKWILARGIIVSKTADGSPARMIGTHTDITALKNAEQKIADSEQRLLKAQKIAQMGNWEMDISSNLLKFSSTVFDIFELKENHVELSSEAVFKMIHAEDCEMVRAAWQQILDGKENLNLIHRIILFSGQVKYIQAIGEITKDNNTGKPIYITGTIQDISERKEAENELAKEKINQQRKITEVTIQAQEIERTELGKELHDNINQILTTTKLYIDMAINDSDIREELLQKSYRNISKAIEEIRNLSKSLVPPSLGDIGLKEAIKELISLLPANNRLRVSLRVTGLYESLIPDTIKLMVFRIVQEQLNNIIKHSQATKAEIKLSISKKMLNIIITDDGVGFDSSIKKRGIGLSNISSRAALHKGQVEIITAPSGGCMLKVIIPLLKNKV